VLFSDLTPSQHSRLYKLLDEALDLPPGEREVWLGKLVQSDPLLAETLRDLFGFEGTGVLEALRGPLAQLVGKLTQRLKPDEALVGRRFARIGCSRRGQTLAIRRDYRIVSSVVLRLSPGRLGCRSTSLN
jgi:hypothetical protein